MNDIHAKTHEFIEGIFSGEKIENEVKRMGEEDRDEDESDPKYAD